MKRDDGKSKNGGFTLLEVLMATIIFAIGLLGVVTMLEVSFSAGTLSSNMTTATELATYMLDRIRQEGMSTTQVFSADATKLQTFNNLDTKNPPSTYTADPGMTAFVAWQPLVQKLPNGRGVVTVQTGPANNNLVTVQVSWANRRGVILTTVLSQ